MAVKTAQYVALRCRSPYSILEGAIHIDDLAKRAKEYRIPALALTDSVNMCGALEFSGKVTAAGLQPIIGVTLPMDCGLEPQPGQLRRDPDGSVVLLAQNEAGYVNLMALSTAAYLDVEATDLPHVKLEVLSQHTEGVIALTGGPDGALNRLICSGQMAAAEGWLDTLIKLFPNRLYIELQRHGLKPEIEAEKVLIDWAYAKDVPLVATNESYFLDSEMHSAHDALLAISEGSYLLEKDRRKVSKQHYFKMPQQMAELFKDIPEAIKNTVDIAKRCAYQSVARAPILPHFGEGGQSEGELLSQQAHAGLKARLASIEPADTVEAYTQRLDFELGVITNMGFPGYFLIVSDFIKWAKDNDIPVGPGRGSGAGSVVAWSLLITDLDPLRYGLLFERFLNPERVSMPDFDIDFCQERRGEVIKYVQNKYGAEQVSHIITFGTLQARAVVRDVGRVMQMPLGQVDRLAKLVPSNPANPVTLGEAIKMERGLREARDSDPAVRDLLDTALKLEGFYRNASTHAAGVVIGDRPLKQLVPLYRDPRSDIPATQFSMKYAEKAGLVKFDFLGLKTLTVIDRALKYLKKQGIEVDLDTVSPATPEAYAPLAQGLSAGVFQLESSGMRDVLRKMAPDTIEELTALISLYRPGPMKNIDSYIERKYGRSKIEYPHPMLETILKETYGIIIYQEQVMQIAQVLSGFSLGDADLLRRAMGKKDQAEMDRQRSRFVDGAAKNNVDGVLANSIFDLVNEFAGYGFNKSHAAAYAMISFRTAYLKALYPTEFIAAIMSLDIANVDKLAQFYQESKRMELVILPPCVNHSGADFLVEDGKVRYALGALKNVGVDAMRHLVAVREEGGPFLDPFDFARRIDTRIVNKRAIENLARSGALDSLEPNRAKVLASASILQSIGSRASEERNSNQGGLFGEEDMVMAEPDLVDASPWGTVEQLDHELGAVGFYLSGHPLEAYANLPDVKHSVLSIDLEERYQHTGQVVKMSGVVRKKQERMSKRGRRFAYVDISDPSGDFEIFINESQLAVSRDILTAGAVVVVRAKLEMRDGEIRIFGEHISSLDTTAIAASIAGFSLRLRSSTSEHLDQVQQALSALVDVSKIKGAKTMGRVEVIFPLEDGREGVMALPIRIGTDDTIRAALKACRAIETIEDIAA